MAVGNGFFHSPAALVSFSYSVAHTAAFDKWLAEAQTGLGNRAALHVFRKGAVAVVSLPRNRTVAAGHADTQARAVSKLKGLVHLRLWSSVVRQGRRQ